VGAVKQRSVLLTDLATAYVHEGEVDKGCELASKAAVTLTRAGYETSAERLREFRQLVRPWQDRGAVKDLDERLGLSDHVRKEAFLATATEARTDLTCRRL
jgi:hypothetical protein